MLILALTLACTGRPSTTPETPAEPVETAPAEGAAAGEGTADGEDAAAGAEDAAGGEGAAAGAEDAADGEDAAAGAEDAAGGEGAAVDAEATAGEDASGGLLADGAECLSNDACSSGVCEGEGCTDDAPGICQPKDRRCTRDLRPYCSCDGVTFRTSGSCPGQRYAATGFCEGDAEPLLQIEPK